MKYEHELMLFVAIGFSFGLMIIGEAMPFVLRLAFYFVGVTMLLLSVPVYIIMRSVKDDSAGV